MKTVISMLWKGTAALSVLFVGFIVGEHFLSHKPSTGLYVTSGESLYLSILERFVFRQKANLGDGEAAWKLYMFYELGAGSDTRSADEEKNHWLESAAQNGYALARAELVNLHLRNFHQQTDKTMKWLQGAADQNWDEAKTALEWVRQQQDARVSSRAFMSGDELKREREK